MSSTNNAAKPTTASPNLNSIVTSYWSSQALVALHRLNIPTYLQQSRHNLASLSTLLGADPQILQQLLGVAKSLDIIEMDSTGYYQLTQTGMCLLPESANSLIPFLDHAAMAYPVWNELPHSIKTGEAAFSKVYGIDMFDYLEKHPENNTFFNRFMEQTTNAWLANAGKYYDFSGHLIDLGGSSGAFSALLLKQFPDLKATVFDLQHVVEQAPPVLEAASVSERCQVVAGSFLDRTSIPQDGDIYLLSRVLLNWDDERAIEILENCRQAMPSGSKILILEFILPDEAAMESYLASLNLFVLFGARMRSDKEFEHLLTAAGFQKIRWIAAAPESMPLFFIEAISK